MTVDSVTDRALVGAMNMLRGCAEAAPGAHLLVVREDPALGYYDAGVGAAVLDAADRLSLRVRVMDVPFTPLRQSVPAALKQAMSRADHTVFLARMGDQMRFGADLGQQATVCYALDAGMLGAPFGTVDHAAMLAVKDAVNAAVAAAERIRVTCPAGSEFGGPGGALVDMDVGIRRFPMSVFTPVSAVAYSGKVALPGFLAGTGSQYYEPYVMEYDGALMAHFECGRLVGFTGDGAAIDRARAHYTHVADSLGIDRDCVHSWHVGIHPGCGFAGPARADYLRWCGAAFGTPRILHFHTCGNYPPGEISWNVLDPTVEIDGVPIWRAGRLDLAAVPGGPEILARHGDLRAAFSEPAQAVGL